MKIFCGEQVGQWDRYTILNEPVESIELMERAAESIAVEICKRIDSWRPFLFLVGKGNNGGDGLAIARIMSNAGYQCAVYMAQGTADLTADARTNFDRLPQEVQLVDTTSWDINNGTVVIDAILGSGMKGRVDGELAELFNYVNSSPANVISVDIPSGMNSDFGNKDIPIIQADITYTIQFPKLAMLLPEAGEFCGEIITVDIGLDQKFEQSTHTVYNYILKEDIRPLLKRRRKYTHKGTYGHALLVCGSEGMIGAAVLAASGAVRSGCGLVTMHLPGKYADTMHATHPSVLVSSDQSDRFTNAALDLPKYSSVGVGCGIGTSESTVLALSSLMSSIKTPMVLDADALNIIAAHPQLKELIPQGSVLTPHSGEFKRLAGEWKDEKDKLRLLGELAAELGSVIVLKGANTVLAVADGTFWINSTGTPAMAKAGSGDVLTGLITGLLAMGYRGEDAAKLGVYLHGLAGEKAAEYYDDESMCSSDISDFISEAYKYLKET